MIEVIKKFSSIIKSYEVIQYDIEPIGYRFKIEIEFINDSKLSVKDYLFSGIRKYSYHWHDNRRHNF